MMYIPEYIHYIQQEIAEKQGYNELVHVFAEYATYLEERLRHNPRDVETVCQLAAVHMELCDWETILPALEDAEKWSLSDTDKARLQTNLAFYHKEYGDEDMCLRYLQSAVALVPDAPNAYDALGQHYMDSSEVKKALPLFEMAFERSNDLRYVYDYGVALHADEQFQEAQTMFDKLQHRTNDRRVRYGVAVTALALGDRHHALAVADSLATEPVDDYIHEWHMAELYSACGEYEKCRTYETIIKTEWKSEWKPSAEIALFCMEGCFLIDCPRHQKVPVIRP